jgi:hypothetical protein
MLSLQQCSRCNHALAETMLSLKPGSQ